MRRFIALLILFCLVLVGSGVTVSIISALKSGDKLLQESNKVWIARTTAEASNHYYSKTLNSYDGREGHEFINHTSLMTTFTYTDLHGNQRTVDIPSYQPFSVGTKMTGWLGKNGEICVDSDVPVCPTYLPDSPTYAGSGASKRAVGEGIIALILGCFPLALLVELFFHYTKRDQGSQPLECSGASS